MLSPALVSAVHDVLHRSVERASTAPPGAQSGYDALSDSRAVSGLVATVRTSDALGPLITAIADVPDLFRLLLLDRVDNPIAAPDVSYHLARVFLVPTLRRLVAEIADATWEDAAFERILPWLDACLTTPTLRVTETTVLHSFTMNDDWADIRGGLSIEKVGDGRAGSVAALSRDDVQSGWANRSADWDGTLFAIVRRFDVSRKPPFYGWNDDAADQLLAQLRLGRFPDIGATARRWSIAEPTLSPIRAEIVFAVPGRNLAA